MSVRAHMQAEASGEFLLKGVRHHAGCAVTLESRSASGEVRAGNRARAVYDNMRSNISAESSTMQCDIGRLIRAQVSLTLCHQLTVLQPCRTWLLDYGAVGEYSKQRYGLDYAS